VGSHLDQRYLTMVYVVCLNPALFQSESVLGLKLVAPKNALILPQVAGFRSGPGSPLPGNLSAVMLNFEPHGSARIHHELKLTVELLDEKAIGRQRMQFLDSLSRHFGDEFSLL